MFKRPEEKRTDVSIGVRLLDDAYQGICDRQVIVSGDSDLVPAIAMVKERFPNMVVTVYVPNRNPARGAAVELRSIADKARSLPLDLLRRAQLPAEFPDGAGGFIGKPVEW